MEIGGEIMAISKVEICGVNTSKLPVLNNEEKEALFARIELWACNSKTFLISRP